MHASRDSEPSSNFHAFCPQLMQQMSSPYCFSNFQKPNDNSTATSSQATKLSFQNCTDRFFTLESAPAIDFSSYGSPSGLSSSSNKCPFSPQCSQSFVSHHSSDNNTYGSSVLSGSPGFDDENSRLDHALWVLKNKLLGPESETDDSGFFNGLTVSQPPQITKYDGLSQMAPHMDIKQLLVACAELMSEAESLSSSDRQDAISASETLMDTLEKKVSVYGDPLQRLGAYMLEGLRARLLSSGSIIYKKLKCNEPTSSELMSYMHVLYQICPYYKFAYTSSNVIISEAMENETRVHIIDFQIAQGSQWISFIQALARRPGALPFIRITGIDDSQSAHARGGGLQLVGQRLAKVAQSCGVPFEFNAAAMSGCEVQLENLRVRDGEALAVNFPYMLHHMPDESVSTMNHRDRLLRLIKSLSPKIVTLVEQESNTNTGTFLQRFCETLDYYTAMFESIDAARDRDDKQRTSAEEHCVARDVVNIIACEGVDRIERHELYGKWRLRLMMAGFSPLRLSSSVGFAVRDVLKEYSSNYRTMESDDALYLGWKSRALATCSAWR